MCLCVSVIKTPLWSLSSPHWQLHSHTALMNGWRERAKKQREKESTRCERKIEATEGCVKRKTYELTSIQDKNNPRARKREKYCAFFIRPFSIHLCMHVCLSVCVCMVLKLRGRMREGRRIMFSMSIKKADECKPMHSVHRRIYRRYRLTINLRADKK